MYCNLLLCTVVDGLLNRVVSGKEKMRKNKVSVGIPVYNGEKWINETVGSILSQTYGDIEVIISDNATTDNTESICRDLSDKDSRVKYFRNDENIGVANNFNNVFYHSTGDYFKWSSVSDLIMPDFIEKCMDRFSCDDDIALVCPSTVLFNEEAGTEEKYVDGLDVSSDSAVERFINYLENIKLNNIMNGVIKSEALKKTGLFKNFLAADVNMIAELALYGKLVYLPEYLFYRRMEEETATVYKPVDEVLAYYNPSRKNMMLFQYWMMDLYYLQIIKRSPLLATEKKILYRYIIKTMYWHKKTLWDDFMYSMKCLPTALIKKWSDT